METLTPGPDESCAIMQKKLEAGEPFYYLRLGDGLFELLKRTRGEIGGPGGSTCDGESYTYQLRLYLLAAIYGIRNDARLLIGDWTTASFQPGENRYEPEGDGLSRIFGPAPRLHFEALLLMRQNIEAITSFWKAVRCCTDAVYVGPHEEAAEMLECDFIRTPWRDKELDPAYVTECLCESYGIVIYGAGLAGHIPVMRHAAKNPGVTYIHAGSAFDPLFMDQRSRSQQLMPEYARQQFAKAGLL